MRTSSNPQYWAGLNNADSQSADITIAGLPYDGAACFRKGAALAPQRLREISIEIPGLLETGEDLRTLSIRDIGDYAFEDDFVASFADIEAQVTEHLSQNFLLTLGGDHSIVIPVHRAFSQAANDDITLLFIDAHTDLSDQFQGSPYSNGCPLRRAMELSHFSPKNTILLGTRCFEHAGLQYIQEQGMTVFPAHEIAERGISAVTDDVLAHLSHTQNLYLSIDIDVLDPAYAPGTGIPDAGGLSTRELITLIRALHVLPVIGADLVEISPPLDHADITSFAGLRIITELFALVSRRKKRNERTTLS